MNMFLWKIDILIYILCAVSCKSFNSIGTETEPDIFDKWSDTFERWRENPNSTDRYSEPDLGDIKMKFDVDQDAAQVADLIRAADNIRIRNDVTEWKSYDLRLPVNNVANQPNESSGNVGIIIVAALSLIAICLFVYCLRRACLKRYYIERRLFIFQIPVTNEGEETNAHGRDASSDRVSTADPDISGSFNGVSNPNYDNPPTYSIVEKDVLSTPPAYEQTTKNNI